MPFSIFSGAGTSVTFYNPIDMFFRNHRIHRISEMLTFPWVYAIDFVIDFATDFATDFVIDFATEFAIEFATEFAIEFALHSYFI